MPTLDEINSPEYQARIRKQAEEQLAPSRDLTLNEIGLGEKQLDQDTTDINRNYDSLAQQLRDEAVKSRGYLTENFNNLGLLQSGMTAAGLGDIEKTLFKKSTETEQDRASKLANIALQRSGLEIKKAEVQQQYNASVSDLVNQILKRDIETEQTRLALEAEKARIEAENRKAAAESSNPFAGLGKSSMSNLPQNTPNPAAVKPLDQFFKDLFESGQFINGTEDFADALSRATTIGGQPNPYLGMSKDQILAVAYQVRKPYEKSAPSVPAGTKGFVSPTKLFGMKG